MKLDVQVLGHKVAQLYRDRDEYVPEQPEPSSPSVGRSELLASRRKR